MNTFKISFAGGLALVATLSFSASALAGTTPLTGWLWSSTAGWVSLNSSNPEISSFGGQSYAVSVSTSTGSTIGSLSGYAWSPYAGWISFNSADVAGCPTSDSYDSTNALNSCAPSVDLSSGKVTGWARALSGAASGSSGATTVTTYAWTKQTGSGQFPWYRMAASSDGAKLAATEYSTSASGYIYTSTDGGVTWTQRTSAGQRYWNGLASSADGTKLVATAGGGGYIYTSTDGGATWTQRTAAGARYWQAVASSADGTKLVAVAVGAGGGNDYIYTSTDGGATWTQRIAAGARYWTQVTSSSDGAKIAAVSNPGTTSGYIYTSADGGATWTQRTSEGAHFWIAVSYSFDGTHLAIADSGFGGTLKGYVYISTNDGSTWTTASSLGQQPWQALALSANGATMAAAATNNYIYISTDSGATWTSQTGAGSRSWGGIAMSSDGSNIAAGDSAPGYIYTYGPLTTAVTTSVNSNGWDGWIHLSGTNHSSPDASGANGTSNLGVTYNPSTNALSGFAWDGAAQNVIGLATSTGSVALDTQDGLFYGFVTVTNNTNSTLAGLRAVLTTPLTSTTTLYDYSGIDSAGYKYLQYNYPVLPGATVVIAAKFYSASRTLPSTPMSYIVSAITTPVSEPSIPSGATPVSVTRTFLSSPAGFPPAYVAEFSTSVGSLYALQYSDDGGNIWHTMYGQGSNAKLFTAGASAEQYIDFGAPADTGPGTAARQYRAYLLPSGTYADRSPSDAGNYIPSITAVDTGFIGWLDFYNAAIGSSTPNSSFSISSSALNLNNAAGTVSGTAQVTLNSQGLSAQTINISANTSGLPSGVSVTAGPTPSSCVVSGGSSCNISFTVQALNTVPDGTTGSFTVTGTRASDGAVQTGTVTVTVNGNAHPVIGNGVNLWAGSATASTTYSYVTLQNKVVPLYWTAKNYGYCTASVPSYPTGATGFSGWTSMATTTTVSTLGSAASLAVNSSLTALSSNPIKLNTTGTYTFKLNCYPVNDSGIKTGGGAVDSPVVTVRVTSSSVTEF